MPYQSKAQARFMHAQHPELASHWDRATKAKKGGFKKLPERVDKIDAHPPVTDHHASARHHQAQLDRMRSFRPRGARNHWTDNLIAHHQKHLDVHRRAIASGKDARTPDRVVKRLPGETQPQAFQRHQKQAAGLITAGAAVPALLALRSGTRASRALASGDKAAQALHSGMQLRHAATATAMGGLAGATGALPVPKRVLSINANRNRKPKIKSTGVASKAFTRKRAHRPLHRIEHARPDTDKHVEASGKPAAPRYDTSGVGKRSYDVGKRSYAIGKASRLSPGFDEHAVRQQFRATEQVRAGQTARRQGMGFGGAGAKAHFNPTSAQKGAAFARRENQAVSSAARKFTRVPSAAPALRTHIAGGQVRDAAIGAAAVGGGLAYLHHRKQLNKRSYVDSVDKAFTQQHKDEAAGAVIGAGGARATSVVGGQSAKAALKVHRANVGTSPVDEQVWARHKASHGVKGPITSSVPNATKVKIMSSYPTSLPGARTQRLLAHKNRPSVTLGLLGAGAVGGAMAAGRKRMNKRLNNRESANLATAGAGSALAGAGALGAGKQIRQNTLRVAGSHALSGNIPSAIQHGAKGLKVAGAVDRVGAAGIGAGVLGAGYALSRRKKVGKSEGVDMSVDAWGIERSDLAKSLPPWLKGKDGKRGKDEEEKLTSPKAKKHKAAKHGLPPSFASNMGKAFTPPKPDMSKPSGGRVATGALVPGIHSVVAGKKGYKARALGNELGGNLLGGAAGGIVGGALTRGRGASAGAAVGSLAGGGLGTASAHRKGYLKKQPGVASKAYVPGSITQHTQQAAVHARKKTSSGKGVEAGLTGATLGGSAALAAHHFAPEIARGIHGGGVTNAVTRGRTMMNIERGAKIGGPAAVGAGLAAAGGFAARRAYHGAQQNKQTKLATTSRQQLRGFTKASASPPPLPSAFERSPFEAIRTVDGSADFVFSDPGVGEVGKNWDGSYYGSAPLHRQRGNQQGPGAGSAAFLGAAAGAGAPKTAQKIKTVAPKLKRATLAAGKTGLTTLRAK